MRQDEQPRRAVVGAGLQFLVRPAAEVVRAPAQEFAARVREGVGDVVPEVRDDAVVVALEVERGRDVAEDGRHALDRTGALGRRARLEHAGADGAGHLVVPCGDDEGPAGGLARDRPRRDWAREHSGGDAGRVEDLRAPVERAEVERAGARREGVVDHALARQEVDDVVLDEHHVARPREDVRLVRLEPHEFRERKAFARHQAGNARGALRAERRREGPRLLGAAAVGAEQDRPERLAVAVREGKRLAEAGDAHGVDPPEAGGRGRDRVQDARGERLGVHLMDARLAPRRVRAVLTAETVPFGREHRDFAPCGPHIESGNLHVCASWF